MKQRFIYLALIVMFFASCEDYYKPKLDVVPSLLVVEAHLTNDQNQNFIRLSKSQDFYNTGKAEKINDAKVYLIEVEGQTTLADERETGYFTFPQTPVAGKKYMLRISYQTDIYESDVVIMPPLPKIDSLYTNYKVEKSFQKDYFNVLQRVQTPSREICIDAPITNVLQYYRFTYQAVLQWMYSPKAVPFVQPITYYGWIWKHDNGLFNITGPKEFSVSTQVKNYPILSLALDYTLYLDSVQQSGMGWILIIDQYGISKESYKMHEKLNQQFSAEGSLFEPILTQVYGNIHCKTDASKIALGFFDLNSYRQYRYFLNLGWNENSKVIQRRLTRTMNIPKDTLFKLNTRPAFWEFND